MLFRSDLQGAVLVSPSHDTAELAGDFSILGGDQTVVDAAGGTVQRQLVTLKTP